MSPYKPDYNHIWIHKMKKLSPERLRSHGVTGEIQRADMVARTGYIMCSRICYSIQQAALVIVDITEPNLNVYYELGLARALRKPLLLMVHESRSTVGDFLDFTQALGLDKQVVVYKSDLSEMLDLAKPFTGVDRTPDPRPASSTQVAMLSNGSANASGETELRVCTRGRKIHDIVLKALLELAKTDESRRVSARARQRLREQTQPIS